MTIKRALSGSIVTVCVSLAFSFSVPAANLTMGYQAAIDPGKVPQADGLYEKAMGQPIDWRRFNSGPEPVTATASGDVQIGNLGYCLLGALKQWGLDTSKVKVVNLQPAQIAAAWKRGDIDGAFV